MINGCFQFCHKTTDYTVSLTKQQTFFDKSSPLAPLSLLLVSHLHLEIFNSNKKTRIPKKDGLGVNKRKLRVR